MCSLEEANEAYRYIGLPGYNPHIKKEVFLRYYDRTEARVNALIDAIKDTEKEKVKAQAFSDLIKTDYFGSNGSKALALSGPTDKDKVLLINSRRVFHIAEKGRSYQEREELARSYFDQVMAVEINPENYRKQELFLQIYIVNKNRTHDNTHHTNIYGFRPIKRNSYLFHRLVKNGFFCGSYDDLKKNIDWSYLPNIEIPKEEICYICASSYFKRKQRKRLAEELIKKLEEIENKYKTDYNWVFWPDLD